MLGEPVQQAMRAAAVAGATGMADPYERLKELTRGKRVTREAMRDFIRSLGMPTTSRRASWRSPPPPTRDWPPSWWITWRADAEGAGSAAPSLNWTDLGNDAHVGHS